MVRNFIQLNALSSEEIQLIIEQAIAWKKEGKDGQRNLCGGKTLAMMFDKDSTRTRLSFEVGALQMGLHPVVLDGQKMHFSKGRETLSDTARMLSSFVDIVLWRTKCPKRMSTLAENLQIPLINGLTDGGHPCQIMAELMTLKERLGQYSGKKVLWIGDYNNVARSWVHVAEKIDIQLRIACPKAYGICDNELALAKNAGADIEVFSDPFLAAKNVDAVVTDVWVSMGDDVSAEDRRLTLKPYQVNKALMAHAASHAVVMHCLPAVRGEEITPEILDGSTSAAWHEAENRLHVQKAILAWCLNKI